MLKQIEIDAIKKIATRAVEIYRKGGLDVKPVDVMMDIQCVHQNSCPLRLVQLSEADDFNLMHDIVGIHNHLDRKTKKLEGCFLPRYAENSNG